MQWTSDVTPGDWLRERIVDADWQPPYSMHMVVPRGFEAYARILHPATRDRPVGQPWPPLPYDQHATEWAAFSAAQPEVDTEHVRWGEVARTFGTRLHGTSQWGRLVGYTDPYNNDAVEDAAGWRYNDPEQGRLDPATLATTAHILAAHTGTPDTGYIAMWEGWGGMLGAMLSQSASMQFKLAPDKDPRYVSHEEMLARSIHNPWNDGYAKERWTPGILSDEISRGPRFALPNRDHVLFTGGITELADASWPERAPWMDSSTPWFTQSPSLIWPEDRAWVLVTEVDFDSTIIAGSPGLIAAICAQPELEALPIPADTVLTWEGDTARR